MSVKNSRKKMPKLSLSAVVHIYIEGTTPLKICARIYRKLNLGTLSECRVFKKWKEYKASAAENIKRGCRQNWMNVALRLMTFCESISSRAWKSFNLSQFLVSLTSFTLSNLSWSSFYFYLISFSMFLAVLLLGLLEFCCLISSICFESFLDWSL